MHRKIGVLERIQRLTQAEPWCPQREWNGSIWPNGRFGASPRQRAAQTEKDDLEDEWQLALRVADAPLGLSAPPKSHSEAAEPSKPRGLKGITAFGKKMVESGAYLLERKYGKQRLSFGTVTIPTCTVTEGWYVSSRWSEIVRVFFQKLGRKLASVGMPKTYLSVTESQPERAEREGHPALHLHFVFVGRAAKGPWLIAPKAVRQMWKEIVSPYLSGEVSWDACESIERIRKSVEGYLGKYMSKGSGLDGSEVCPDTMFSLPSTWWNMSNGLRKAIKDYTIRDSQILAAIVETIAGNGEEKAFKYWKFFERETPQGTKRFGVYGKLARQALADLERVVREMRTVEAKAPP